MLDPSDYANNLAQTVSDLVAQIEIRLIWEIARDVNRGLGGGTRYEVDMAARYGALYARLQRQLGKPWQNVLATVQAALDKAAEAGQGMAERDLAGRLANRPETLGVPITNVRALEVIASDLHRVLADLPALALRNAFDSYQQIISTPAALNASGVLTRRKATQDALNGFAARGIDGFTDKAGRTWHIDTYAEMATRTGAAHALRTAYEGELIARGEDLVLVTGNTYTCRLCAPWQDEVLSLTGLYPAGTYRLPSAVGDGYVTVHVAGTMEEARAAGLHHPNCTHSEGLYLPGATVIEPGTMGIRDAETYDASQKQRALEREIRKHKRLLVAAITGEAETKARAAIRGYQAQIRELLAEHPKLQRKSYREAVPKPSDFHTWTRVAGPKKPPGNIEAHPLDKLKTVKPGTVKPGRVVVPEGMTNPPKDHELETARVLSTYGIDVTFLEEVYADGKRNPDVRMLGGIWEFKAPEGASESSTISSQFKRASRQSQHLVLDLRRTPLDDALAVSQAARRFYGQSRITGLIIIDKQGSLTVHRLPVTLWNVRRGKPASPPF